MNKERKAREFVDSANIDDYLKLPKRLKEKLKAFDKVSLIRPQPHVRLFRADYVDLDSQVRDVSGGKHNVTTVRYRGLPFASWEETA